MLVEKDGRAQAGVRKEFTINQGCLSSAASCHDVQRAVWPTSSKNPGSYRASENVCENAVWTEESPYSAHALVSTPTEESDRHNLEGIVSALPTVKPQSHGKTQPRRFGKLSGNSPAAVPDFVVADAESNLLKTNCNPCSHWKSCSRARQDMHSSSAGLGNDNNCWRRRALGLHSRFFPWH